ncbi:MAG TPA: exodeoxyribonuclease VII large subunit [Rudaea sp.]|nr:exodeoxyribonuclease VII large subunit [Rudaea sp.]
MIELPTTDAAERDILSPSELVRLARATIEQRFPLIWVEGEISNFARPASGHLYFSLKDAHAQVRCAMFKPKSSYLRFRPADGMRVLVRVRVSLYEARGEFQLIVEHMQEAGEGALLREFELLKARLGAEGLFDASRKRILPVMPRRIAVITSPTGAAIRDVLNVVARRFSLARIEVLPVPVQGTTAAAAIAKMLAAASNSRRYDVIVLTRGGGSLEDLWAFNDEALARAIRASAVPVVSAVGHEVDFTIADFAADVRAPTPSAAAELLVPDSTALARGLRQSSDRLRQQMRHRLHALSQRNDHAWARLRAQHPQLRLTGGTQRLRQLHARLQSQHPMLKLERRKADVRLLQKRLHVCMVHQVEKSAQRVGELVRALNAVSPLATLQRGYAIVIDIDSGRVVRSIHQVANGTRLLARVADGEFALRVSSRD